MKIGLLVVAVALLGVSATAASLAKDAASNVNPHRPGNTSGKVGATFRLAAPENLHARRLPAPGTVQPMARNAIGLPVARHGDIDIQARSGEHLGARNPISAREVPRVPASGVGNLAKADQGLTRQFPARPGASPNVNAPILHHGTIAATGLIRPNPAPSAPGGQAKILAGINGTTIQPKHR